MKRARKHVHTHQVMRVEHSEMDGLMHVRYGCCTVPYAPI